jgi:hypothetical protein
MIGKIFPRKLNKESEISLIKPDEMLDALNVLASGGEGNDASIIKKAHGNIESFANDPSNTFSVNGGNSEDVVGYVVDESSERIYYFTKGDSSESVYLAERVSETEMKITLLLRDSGLGFDKYVAADVIKTPKKDISFLTQDGSFSGQFTDGTDVFDFQFESDGQTVVDNQTFIIVLSQPNYFTSPIYNGTEKIFYGQMSVKNIGSEPGEVTITQSLNSGNADNIALTFDATSQDSMSLTLNSGQVGIIQFRASFAADIDPADASYSVNFLVEETPGPNNPTPLTEDFDKSITLQFVEPTYPIQMIVTPTSFAGGLNGDVNNIVATPSYTGLSANNTFGELSGIEVPETQQVSYLGFFNVEITLQNPINASFFLLPMTLRCGTPGGTEGNYPGSDQGWYTDPAQILSDQLSPFVSINLDITEADFLGGTTCTKTVYFGRNWDSNNLDGEVINGILSFKIINDETGQPFGMTTYNSQTGEVESFDDAPLYTLGYVDYEYTIANVPSPVNVVPADGIHYEDMNIEPRVYRVTEDALVGGGTSVYEFDVVNTGEATGFFNIVMDPAYLVHKGARGLYPTAFEILYSRLKGFFESFYNAVSFDVTVSGQQTQVGIKPNFRKSFADSPTGGGNSYDTNGIWNFFQYRSDGIGGVGYSAFDWHPAEGDQTWIEIESGATATIRVRMSNTDMGVYPLIPHEIGVDNGAFGTWEIGSAPITSGVGSSSAFVYPKQNSSGVGPEFLFENYNPAFAVRPLPFLEETPASQYWASSDQAINTGVSPQILAAPIWKAIRSALYIDSSPNGSFGNATTVPAGQFSISTIQSTAPELVVVAKGSYADPVAYSAVGSTASIDASTPLINTYYPTEYNTSVASVLPPTTVVEADLNSNYSTKGNIVLEHKANAGAEGLTDAQTVHDLSFNHYGRINGKPLHLCFYALSVTTSGPSPTVTITANDANAIGYSAADYSVFGPHTATEVSSQVGPQDLSGSIGTTYVGCYLSSSNLEEEAWINGNEFSPMNFGHDAWADLASSFYVQNGGSFAVASPRDESLLYESTFFGPTINHGVHRQFTQTMTPGSFLLLTPSHMLSYNYLTLGQLSPSIDVTSSTQTMGMRVSHNIVASGFSNDDAINAPGTNNKLCVEQAHLVEDYFTFHATGTSPGGVTPPPPPPNGDPFNPASSPPPPDSGERSTLPDPSSPPSGTSNSLNLSTDRDRDEAVKRSDSLNQSGISTKKKRRY